MELIKRVINSFCRNILSIQMSKYRPERQAIMDAKKLFRDNGIIACEIGTFKGEHALEMFKHLNIDKLYLIDPYERYESYESDESCKDVVIAKKHAHKILKKYSDKIVWIEKYSDDAISDIQEELDFLHIDGNHYSPYIDNDVKNYYTLVKNGGIVSGHDYIEKFRDVIDAVNKFASSIGKKVTFGYGTDWVIFK